MLKMILFTLAATVLISSPALVMAGRSSQPHPKQVILVDPRIIPVEDSLVMGNPNGFKKLYIFTDPDCPSCRRLHSELKQLERISQDVAIHIMLFPLLIHPSAFDKSRVIVARKSSKLLDEGLEGKELPSPIGNEGKDSLEAIIRFANSNGISRTPTLVLPDGKLMVGGMSAEALKQMLDGK